MILYILLALFSYIGYRVYKFTRCPKELESLKAVPLTSFFYFFLSKESFPVKMQKEFQPLIDEHGIIRVCYYEYISLYILINV
jgi:hypothetical protein